MFFGRSWMISAQNWTMLGSATGNMARELLGLSVATAHFAERLSEIDLDGVMKLGQAVEVVITRRDGVSMTATISSRQLESGTDQISLVGVWKGAET